MLSDSRCVGIGYDFVCRFRAQRAGNLERTLQATHGSARAIGQPYEAIVVEDASTDSTAEVARQNNIRVVRVNQRQIAATRNSGARAAHGERLFFVDADTTITSRAVAAAYKDGTTNFPSTRFRVALHLVFR